MILALLALHAGQGDSLAPAARAARLAGERIAMDGRLDDAAWTRAVALSGFRQREPEEGAPATDSTEVRIVYDEEALYVGITAYSGQPSSVTARVLQRDRLMGPDFFGRPQFAGDDAVAVLLDPFHDHRNGFVFATNPNGAEFDALLTDEGREFNVDWRAVWTVKAARTPTGWTAELAIPFRTLRYPAGDGPQRWGFNVARVARRNNEETLWTAWSRDNEGFHRVSRAGHLDGLERLPRTGLALEWKPFLLLSGDHSPGDTDGRIEAGLDAKWEVRPGLTLDVTANTDFAQVEADSQQVNLTRFDLFFPEKREFFLENAGVFEFGSRLLLEPPPFLLFFSRRIGISDSGEVPILGGVRLTGRAGRQTLGFLDVATDQGSFQERSNYAVARVKRDIGGSSYVGAMLTDLRRAGGSANTAGGLDWSIWPSTVLNLQGFAAATGTRGGGGDGTAYRLAADLETDRWGWVAYTIGVSADAETQMGFVTRTDLRRYESFVRVTARPRALGLRRVDAFYDGNVASRWDGGFQEAWTGPGVGLEWESGESFSVYYLAGRQQLDSAFDFSDSIPVAPGASDFDVLGWFGSTARQRALVLGTSGSTSRSYNGRIASAEAHVTLSPDRHLSLQVGGGRSWIRLPNGSLRADLASARVSYAFSTELFVNALVQYNSLDRSASANVRVNFIHRPGSDLFVVLNEQRGSATSAWDFDRRGAVVKLTYLTRL